jgi:hypothetical protein
MAHRLGLSPYNDEDSFFENALRSNVNLIPYDLPDDIQCLYLDLLEKTKG